MRRITADGLLRAGFLCALMAGLCFGAGESDPPAYLAATIRNNPPIPRTLTTYPANGPYTKPVLQVGISGAREYAVYSGWVWIRDSRTSAWRMALPTSGALSLLRVIGQNVYIDGPQGFAATDVALSSGYKTLVRVPGTALLTDLAAFSDGFAAANGTARIFFSSDIGAWSALGKLPADNYEVLAVSGEELITLGKKSRRLEVWSSKQKRWRSAGSVPAEMGSIRRLFPNGKMITIAASNGIYEGNEESGGWRRLDSPNSEISSLAFGDGMMLAGTASGLWNKVGGLGWARVESQGSRALVTRLRGSGSRLFACTEGGLQESTDWGQHWLDSYNLAGADVRDVASAGKREFAATGKGLFERASGGSDWKPSGPARGLGQLEFTESMWVAAGQMELGSEQVPSLSISTDEGGKWSEVSLPADAHVWRSVKRVDGVLYAATDAGVFRMVGYSRAWESAQFNLPVFTSAVLQGGQHRILIGGDNRLFAMRDVNHGNRWESVGPALIPVFSQLLVFDISAEASSPPLLMAGTGNGLFWITTGNAFLSAITPVALNAPFGNARSILEMPAPVDGSWKFRFVGTETGVYYVANTIPEFGGWLGPWNRVEDLYNRYSNQPWFWIVTAVGGLLSVYLLGMGALLCAYWLGSNVFIGRSWLISLADKPLQVVPRLGRWALFIGYRRRLSAKVAAIGEVERNYFGLTALLPGGGVSAPDTTGDILHNHLAAALGGSRAIVITGRAGAGKTTVLARLAYLAFEGRLPKRMNRMLPIFVSAAHYKGDLVQAISDTLRKRDGVPVDEKGQTVRAQLATGGILVLFDGYSEVKGDKLAALKAMRETAGDPEFERCRFLFGGRPLPQYPAEVPVFELQPIEFETVKDVYLPCFDLSAGQQKQILKQLTVFGNRPIDPLLLTMVVADSRTAMSRKTFSALFEAYFRRLLKIEPEENDKWEGWRFCLESFAEWFLLASGVRGMGMEHRALLDAIAGKGVAPGVPLFTGLKRYYRLPLKDELEIVEALAAAALLRRDKNWKFAHDAYEEFFAAGSLQACLANARGCPISEKWLAHPEELKEVSSYLRETISAEQAEAIRGSDWAEVWKRQALGLE